MVAGDNYVRHAVKEWSTLLVALLLLSTFLIVSQTGQRAFLTIRHLVYDFCVAQVSPGASPVTIVAIDEESIAQLGRWPWKRTIHAALIESLKPLQPAVIGFDVLFTEPSNEDQLLQTALASIEHGVAATESMELSSGRRVALLPVDSIRNPDLDLGHAAVAQDSDSTIRSIHLSEGGIPAFALQLAKRWYLSQGQALPKHFTQILDVTTKNDQSLQFSRGDWRSEFRLSLPFAASKPSVQTVSYAAVLRGEVHKDAIKNRIIIVGATAAGLGDLHATPKGLWFGSVDIVPGVQIHARALATLLNQSQIQQAPIWLTLSFTAFIICLAMAGMFRLSAGYALTWVVLVAVSSFAISFFTLQFQHIWIDCSRASVLSLIAFPLWSWRRIQAAVAGLASEAEDLINQPFPWPRPAPANIDSRADPLARRMASLSQAASELRFANRFYAATLDAQSHPVLVVGQKQKIVFVNRAARLAFTSKELRYNEDDLQLLNQTFFENLNVPEKMLRRLDLEARDKLGRDWLISIDTMGSDVELRLPALSARSRVMIQLVDISPLRAAQRERDEAMGFLSHDIRSPQISLLNWVEQERKVGKIPATALETVERHSQRALTMADSFLRLARAETQDLVREEIVLSILCEEAVDALYSTARAKSIKFLQLVEGDDVVLGDASLLRRAIINLVDNAVKYGPTNSSVLIKLYQCQELVILDVCDQGPGVSAQEAELVFKPYYRGISAARASGTGLGLPFVRTVAERHGGSVGIVTIAPEKDSYPSAIRLCLPAHKTSTSSDRTSSGTH